MDKDQITSNLGELIKNQIEICEKLDKIAKRIKKIGKPKKEPNYELKGGETSIDDIVKIKHDINKKYHVGKK